LHDFVFTFVNFCGLVIYLLNLFMLHRSRKTA
jgi:lipid-A-disaccharide synthase-like uncharacterized protein